MERNGFTLVEMLIAIVVLCTIVAIALPMRVVQIKKSERLYAKAQLVTIKESQDRYKMEHGLYTTDTTKLANWKNGNKRYRFQVDYADKSRFTAQAHGDTDNDKVYDDVIWAIDQSGTLIQIK
jgi:prepilin-type N-terminal cleavage/methylation domain-containing protein